MKEILILERSTLSHDRPETRTLWAYQMEDRKQAESEMEALQLSNLSLLFTLREVPVYQAQSINS